MPPSSRPARPASRPGAVCAGVAALLVLAGCGSEVEGAASPAGPATSEEAPTSSSPSSAPGSSSEAPDDADEELAAGLLPEDAFGPGALVTEVSPEDLEQGAEMNAEANEGATVTPESCAAAVQSTQVDVTDFDAVAAQSASVGTSVTAELLLAGGPVQDVVAGLAEQVAACPSATVTSPQVGEATVTFTVLDAPDLGDASVAVSYETTIASPDGATLTVPALLGLVQDGDRLLTLVSTDASGGGVDPLAFVDLLTQAYEYQSEQLD